MGPVENRSDRDDEFRPMLWAEPIRTPLDRFFTIFIACLLVAGAAIAAVAASGILP